LGLELELVAGEDAPDEDGEEQAERKTEVIRIVAAIMTPVALIVCCPSNSAFEPNTVLESEVPSCDKLCKYSTCHFHKRMRHKT
jgi:hypothetical protein